MAGMLRKLFGFAGNVNSAKIYLQIRQVPVSAAICINILLPENLEFIAPAKLKNNVAEAFSGTFACKFASHSSP